jgi:hypothetical protein
MVVDAECLDDGLIPTAADKFFQVMYVHVVFTLQLLIQHYCMMSSRHQSASLRHYCPTAGPHLTAGSHLEGITAFSATFSQAMPAQNIYIRGVGCLLVPVLPCCDPTSLLSSVAADDALLESFGYRPELHRAMGFFTNFGMSFSIVSILTGLTGEQKSCSCRAAEWVTPVASLMMVPVAAWLPPLHRLTYSSSLMRSSSCIAVLRSMMCHSRFNYKVQFSTFEHFTSLLLSVQSSLAP